MLVVHQRRRVSFAPTSELILVESHCDNGNSEDGDSDSTATKPITLWFTRADEELFKSKTIIRIHAVRRIMRLNQSGGHAPPSAAGTLLLLGLEKFITREVTEEYTRRRQKLMHDILEESSAHYQHHDAGSKKNSIEDRLSKISAKNSEWARVQARLSALSLEIDLLADSIQDCCTASR
jgi:hypothetical protein